MKKHLKPFKELPRSILLLVVASLVSTIIHVSFMTTYSLAMASQGYTDDIIASVISYKFIGVMVFALPMGLWIKGRRLKPFFLLTGIFLPAGSFISLYGLHIDSLIHMKMGGLVSGLSILTMQVCSIPFILRFTSIGSGQIEAIALKYSTFPLGSLFSGIFILLLSQLDSFVMFNTTYNLVGSEGNENILFFISMLSFLSLPILLLVEEKFISTKKNIPTFSIQEFFKHNWSRISFTLLPHFLIAIGAGFTIPFMSLIFNRSFGMSVEQFNYLVPITSLLVFVTQLSVPALQKRFGNKIMIIGVQSISIIFLVLLSISISFSMWPYAIYIAAICYIVRQPLMNMAGPSTTQLIMNYVGKNNHELLSALQPCVWSGSWFLSAVIFKFLRSHNVPFWTILMITASLYVVGVFCYGHLINRESTSRVV